MVSMSRFTALESDILDALAWDLRDIAPDLAGQFAESLPGSRRNTGSGLFTELIVDRSRPPPLTEPTGRFGTVHAMVGDLPDPIAFQVELRQGRLLSLHGDAYGQDTRALDFARAPFDQVFTLNGQGDSIAFDPAALMQPSPLLDLHRHTDQDPPLAVEPPLVNIGALQRVQRDEPQDLMTVLFGAKGETANDLPASEPAQSVWLGAWAAIAVFAIIAVAVFRVPIVVAGVAAIWLGRLAHSKRGRSVIARLMAQTRRDGVNVPPL